MGHERIPVETLLDHDISASDNVSKMNTFTLYSSLDPLSVGGLYLKNIS